MIKKQKTPPFNRLIGMLNNDDTEGAIKMWRSFCAVDGTCSRGFDNQSQPNLYCANMLHASLLGKALGRYDKEGVTYHTLAQKLAVWISEQEQA
ncbi:MAG: hypothetical protein JKY92_03590 [Magnetovibrio sp.]|nr:hypothetical protein [Magnetovibrio sp.]